MVSLPPRRLKFKPLVVIALVPALILMFIAIRYKFEVDHILRVVNLMGTFIHEAGHTLWAWITGGYVAELVVNPEGSGHAMIGGGIPFFYLPAGYMSSTLLTALMFAVNNRTRWGEVIPFTMGIIMIVLTYTLGAKLAGGVTTHIVGYTSGAILLYFGLHPTVQIPGTNVRVSLPDWVWMAFVNVISLYYAMGGILSLEYLSRHAAHGNPDDISRFTDMYFGWMHPTTMAAILMMISIAVWLIVFVVCARRLFQKEEK